MNLIDALAFIAFSVVTLVVFMAVTGIEPD